MADFKNNESFAHLQTKQAICKWINEGLQIEGLALNHTCKAYCEYPLLTTDKITGHKPWTNLTKFENGKISMLFNQSPLYNQLVELGFNVFCVADIAIIQNNELIAIVEVIHKNDLSERKKEFYSFVPHVFTVDTNYIWNMVGTPSALKLKSIHDFSPLSIVTTNKVENKFYLNEIESVWTRKETIRTNNLIDAIKHEMNEFEGSLNLVISHPKSTQEPFIYKKTNPLSPYRLYIQATDRESTLIKFTSAYYSTLEVAIKARARVFRECFGIEYSTDHFAKSIPNEPKQQDIKPYTNGHSPTHNHSENLKQLSLSR